MLNKIKNANIRFNLEKPLFKSAWDFMQGADKTEFPSHSILMATAINEFFECRSKQAAPFLENREREEAFKADIILSIEKALEKYLPAYILGLSGAAKIIPTAEQTIEFAKEEPSDEPADITDDKEIMSFLGY